MRAVLFDVGGVLATFQGARLVERWGERLGRDLDGIYSAVFDGNDDTALVGAVAADDWWCVVRARLALSVEDFAAFRADFSSHVRYDAELGAFIRRLRGSVRTAFVTNAWSDMRDILAREGLLDCVDELVCSAEVGCAKPHPRIYWVACERLAVSPGETVLVDDTLENVDAACALGMRAIRFESAGQTIAAVEAALGSGHRARGPHGSS